MRSAAFAASASVVGFVCAWTVVVQFAVAAALRCVAAVAESGAVAGPDADACEHVLAVVVALAVAVVPVPVVAIA